MCCFYLQGNFPSSRGISVDIYQTTRITFQEAVILIDIGYIKEQLFIREGITLYQGREFFSGILARPSQYSSGI
jgi:hypothetical protein